MTHGPQRAKRVPRIVPAASLQPGLATIVVSLPHRTIRGRVLMVQVHPQGGVQVAFSSGDVITLSERTMVGRIDPPPRSPRRSTAARA